jgi:hypothetical protein
MEVLFDLIPEIIGFVIAVGVAVARTTETAIDNKVAKMAKNHQSQIKSAVKELVGANSGGNSPDNQKKPKS